MKVLVAGAGAVGQWLAARLLDAGHEAIAWTTTRHLSALQDLHITGLTTWSGRVPACSDEATLAGPFDAIVLTCKAHQTQHLAPRAATHLARDGVFVSLQNGLGNGAKLARFVAPARVAVALTSHGITLEAPGRLRHAGEGATQVGPHAADGEMAARRAQTLLADAGLAPAFEPEMRGFVWRKALINHSVNPVAALHGVPNGEVLSRPELWALSQSLLREGQALAQRARVHLPPGDLTALLETTLRRTATNRVSMLQDVEARRATEVEQLTGRLVRLAEKLLVSMPRSEAVYGRVKDLEASYLGAEAARAAMWDELPWETEPF